jgi:hypothetical protein
MTLTRYSDSVAIIWNNRGRVFAVAVLLVGLVENKQQSSRHIEDRR